MLVGWRSALMPVGPAAVWIGLENSDDAGAKFDVKAEVYQNATLVSSGEIDGVSGGSSGFNHARLRSVVLNSIPSRPLAFGDTLTLKLSVRVAANSGRRSGTARLWYDDQRANSGLNLTISGTTAGYYLRGAFLLKVSPGAGTKKTIDVFVDRAVNRNAWKPFGAWSVTHLEN